MCRIILEIISVLHVAMCKNNIELIRILYVAMCRIILSY